MQLSIDHTNTWLKWTQTMKAKPSKCICLGMKLFEKKIKNEQYIPTTDSVYSPFDPGLSIDGVPMNLLSTHLKKTQLKRYILNFLEGG
jgi:hypothetical protein